MSWKHRVTEWLRPFDLLWDRVKRYTKTRKARKGHNPVHLMAYRGYCSSSKVWLKGRVLEDRFIIASKEDSVWRNLINNYKRFSSREIWGAEVLIHLGSERFSLLTDREGYFELDAEPPQGFLRHPETWLQPMIDLVSTPWVKLDQRLVGEVLFPTRPRFGIISDIDDTIIRTGVTSRLMWRAIYRTLLKNAGSRLTFKEASAFFRALSSHHQNPPGLNPVFYVSNSPWNLYDLINDFLRFNHFPKGPILLRDLGLPADPLPHDHKGHKFESIARIFRTFPQLDFVLIGDSGEKDADIYLEITRIFPGRVRAIYIRDVQHQARTRRVRDLIQNSGRTEVKLLSHFGEAVHHAAELDLLSEDDYYQIFQQNQ